MQLARFAAVICSCSLFVGCTTHRGAPVYGVHRVSSRDLDAAVAAVQSYTRDFHAYAFRVVTPREIWIYYNPDRSGNYLVARRNNGEWKYDGGSFVIYRHD